MNWLCFCRFIAKPRSAWTYCHIDWVPHSISLEARKSCHCVLIWLMQSCSQVWYCLKVVFCQNYLMWLGWVSVIICKYLNVKNINSYKLIKHTDDWCGRMSSFQFHLRRGTPPDKWYVIILFSACRPTSLDAFVFGYIAPLHKAPLSSGQLQQHLKQLTNLCQFSNGILKNFFTENAPGELLLPLCLFKTMCRKECRKIFFSLTVQLVVCVCVCKQ